MDWPANADEITAEWLTGALAPLHPGADVESVEIVERHEVTNAHAKLRVTYRESGGAPESIIASGMGQREARFYAELAPSVDMRVPDAHVARTDEDGMFAILLEDLELSGCQVSDGTWGIPLDAVAGAIEDLA